MKRRGRKSNLTSQLQRIICKLLERGHTISTTCAAAGISERSYHDYCERDAAFLAATQRARAKGRARIVESILDSPDWRAKAWYLERTEPAQFARSAERPLPAEPQPVRDLSHMVKLTLHRHPEVDVGEVIHARCVIAAYEKAMAASRRVVPAATVEPELHADGELLDNTD